MPLFTRKAEPLAGAMNPNSGTEVIRASLAAHAKKSFNIATIARDLHVSADTLLGFVERRAVLSPDVMAGLMKILFHGHAELDVEHDLLRPAYREPARPVGVYPGVSPTNLPPGMEPRQPGVFSYAPPLYPRLTGEAEPAIARKPGWA
jgi:hypothetical protein